MIVREDGDGLGGRVLHEFAGIPSAGRRYGGVSLGEERQNRQGGRFMIISS